ncbi:ATP-binding protein [Haloarcula hispanica]|uniref:ATP-binding protein n=1 Tax=Haloarcula hispanica TaxID=51589 RepID=A0A5J5LNT0_HALHI|nr:tetratricopeptide repeat protein [Haloarcula hispanica]KAA9411110.1 ATP-binding protein [Haloarcula hispanica]
MNLPPEVVQSLGLGIAASGVVEVGSVTMSKAHDVVRDTLSDQSSHAVGIAFGDTLREKLKAIDSAREGGELANVGEQWDTIADHLNTVELPALGKPAATNHIVEAIADAKGFDISNTPGLRSDMEEAVEEAYAEALTEFHREIDGPQHRELSQHLDRAILTDIRELAEDLRPLKGYRIHDATTESLSRVGREIVTTSGGDPDIKFVDPGVEIPDEDTLLIFGPGGVGKTRLMSELLEQYGASDTVEHVVVPKRDEEGGGYTLATDRHIEPLEQEPFAGDVLLVWDDVPNTDAEDEITTFKTAVNTLRQRLSEQGNRLHVLATARTGELDPSVVERSHGADFWHRFEPVYVEWTKSEEVLDLIERMAEEYGVTLGTEEQDAETVQQALAAKAQAAATPGYIEAVLTVTNARLTLSDVEELPEDLIGFWNEQFKKLGTDSPEYTVLRVLKVFSELNLPPFRRLVCAIGEYIIDGEQIGDALNQLDDRQWIRQIESEDSDAELAYLHDVRAEAVEFAGSRQASVYRDSVSEFLLSEIEPRRDLPPDFDAVERLHNAVGVGFADQFGDQYNTTAEAHFNQGSQDAGGTYAETRNNYALLLKNELDRPEDAETQYQQAIKDNGGTYAEARNNYALLLHEELDRPEDAETQYQQAIKDNGGIFAEARYNYALLLREELDRPEDAETQYQQATKDNGGTFAEARNNYALLLNEELDRPEDAETQYQQATKDNGGTFAEAHYNFATLLEDLGRLQEARSQVEQSISAWRERGRLDNAIHDYRALVRITTKQADHDAAIAYAADAICLCVRADDNRVGTFINHITDPPAEVGAEMLALHAYRAAIWCASDARTHPAHKLFGIAFMQRDTVSGEARRRAYSAGVGLAALHEPAELIAGYRPLEQVEYDDIDMLLSHIAEESVELRPPVADCLTLLAGVTVEPIETDQIYESLRRREEIAFGNLTTLAM